MTDLVTISDERLAEIVGAGVPCVPIEPWEVAHVVQELRSLRAQGGVRVKPWETRPQGEDALEPSEVDVHEGAWAIVVGTNAKPAGWIDTHALFAHQLYQDQILPSAAPVPSSSDKKTLEDAAAFFEDFATMGNPAPLAIAQALRRILSAFEAPSEGEVGDPKRRREHIGNIDGLVSTYRPPDASSEVTDAAQFLIERLDDFERGSLCDTIEDACRDFDGHVSPAIERLRAALAAKGGQ